MAGLKIPEFQESGKVATGIGAKTVSYGAAMAEGRGISKSGERVFEHALVMQQEEAVADATDAMASFQNEQRDYLINQGQRFGKEARGLHKEGGEFYEESYAAYTKGMSRKAQQIFRQRFEAQKEMGLNQLAKHEATEHNKYKLSTLETFGATISSNIIKGISSEALDSELASYYDSLKTMFPGIDHAKEYNAFVEKNVGDFLTQAAITSPTTLGPLLVKYQDLIPARKLEEIRKLAEAAGGEIVVGVAYTSLIDKHGNNRYGALIEAADPKNWERLGLNFKTSRDLVNVLKDDISIAETNRDLLEERETEKWKVNDYQAWYDQLSGTLTNEELMRRANEKEISQGALVGIKNWIRSAPGGGRGVTHDNPIFVSQIYERMVRGEDIRDDILDGLKRGQIKNQTFMTLSKAFSDQAYQRGIKKVAQALKPGPFDRWNADKNMVFKEGTDMFHEIIESDSNISPEQAGDMVIDRYTRDMHRTEAGLPYPKYMPSGGEKSNITDLDLAAMNTTREHAAGNLSDEEYAIEMINIQRLEHLAIERQRAILGKGNQ